MGQAKQRKASGNYPDTTQPKPSAQTVSWEILGDLALHPKSSEVIQLLTELRGEYDGFGGKAMYVTLEATPKQPLIRSKVVGMGAFIGLVSGLQELGLSDRLEHASNPEAGIDAAFS